MADDFVVLAASTPIEGIPRDDFYKAVGRKISEKGLELRYSSARPKMYETLSARLVLGDLGALDDPTKRYLLHSADLDAPIDSFYVKDRYETDEDLTEIVGKPLIIMDYSGDPMGVVNRVFAYLNEVDENSFANSDDESVYTSGQVAKIAGVASRTVQKWIDNKKDVMGEHKLKGDRLPGSLDRRVSHASLVDFFTHHGMIDYLDEPVYSTGEVAEKMKVASRTVGMWFDNPDNKFGDDNLKGYVLPGSKDRRIPKSCLANFVKTHFPNRE